MDTPSGIKDSIPAWIKFSVQAPGEIPYNGIYYDPPEEVCLVTSHCQFLIWATRRRLIKMQRQSELIC